MIFIKATHTWKFKIILSTGVRVTNPLEANANISCYVFVSVVIIIVFHGSVICVSYKNHRRVCMNALGIVLTL